MENEQSPFQAAVKAGLITGLVLAVITFVCYFVDYQILGSGWLSFLSLVIYCGLIIYFGIQYRKEQGGFMNYGTAFQFSFFSLLIMLVVTTLSNMLLFLVVDPGLGERMVAVGLENTLEMMDSFGMGDNISSEQLDELEKGMLEGYTAWGMLKGAGVMVIFYAILALILAAIIKKKDKSLDY